MEQKGAFLWKIEKIVSKGDYDYAVVKKHPNATKHGYVLHHRVVMENHLKRLLNPDEVVHHKDGNKKNNSIENLEVMTTSDHVKLHASKIPKKMVLLKCPACGREFTKRRNSTHLVKPSKWTACSNSCRGKFSRHIQLHGRTKEVEDAISANILKEYLLYKNNAEVTDSQREP